MGFSDTFSISHVLDKREIRFRLRMMLNQQTKTISEGEQAPSGKTRTLKKNSIFKYFTLTKIKINEKKS